MATVSSLMYRVFGGLARVSRELTEEYRPELHYMRGPGPKWRERHGKSGDFLQKSGLEDGGSGCGR